MSASKEDSEQERDIRRKFYCAAIHTEMPAIYLEELKGDAWLRRTIRRRTAYKRMTYVDVVPHAMRIVNITFTGRRGPYYIFNVGKQAFNGLIHPVLCIIHDSMDSILVVIGSLEQIRPYDVYLDEDDADDGNTALAGDTAMICDGTTATRESPERRAVVGLHGDQPTMKTVAEKHSYPRVPVVLLHPVLAGERCRRRLGASRDDILLLDSDRIIDVGIDLRRKMLIFHDGGDLYYRLQRFPGDYEACRNPRRLENPQLHFTYHFK
ncbi:hypothetical protein EDD18DRAFT_1333494 [Armillaria luteobubalina]|uniref:Uncharacterized protein n=1 Tax=Armillaria luteobubalina TaxID=153913 RepID=A0AA39Q2N0_9AGAR|nr:hypothetical protein EDD18DRAFT_1333494 [Armillaria luteobubalina]